MFDTAAKRYYRLAAVYTVTIHLGRSHGNNYETGSWKCSTKCQINTVKLASLGSLDT